MDQAKAAGIRWLDTAQAYGNAEAVLSPVTCGPWVPPYQQAAGPVPPWFSLKDVDAWEQAFHASCQRIGVCGLDALLLHAPGDLAKPGGQHLEEWLLGLRARGAADWPFDLCC